MIARFPRASFVSHIHIAHTQEDIADIVLHLSDPLFVFTEESLYGCLSPLLPYLPKNLHIYAVPCGQKVKSRKTQHALENFLARHHAHRHSTLLCLGGGSILDIGGFVASIYARGILLVFVPTTLLAMVDACFGGKTAIDTALGKNLLGSFYPAEHILLFYPYIQSLPLSCKQDALGEILKYSLIHDTVLFQFLQQHPDTWHEERHIDFIIRTCLQTKMQIVAKDPADQGMRKLLNFGHTIGHALEACYHLSHGQAVLLGILAETLLCVQQDYLDKQEAEKIFALPFFPSFTEPLYTQRLFAFLLRDKKCKDHTIDMPMLCKIGKPMSFEERYVTALSLNLLKRFLTSQEFRESLQGRLSL